MQISAANLVIAAQQGAARPTPAKDKPAFEPLPFQQVESKPAPQAARPGSAPMGSQVDIRV
jgi:hypothetical protein